MSRRPVTVHFTMCAFASSLLVADVGGCLNHVDDGSGADGSCSTNATGYRGKNGSRYSFVCAAAIHAGRISGSGVAVQFEILPGQGSYAASYRNGVTSRSYGSWVRSFAIVSGG